MGLAAAKTLAEQAASVLDNKSVFLTGFKTKGMKMVDAHIVKVNRKELTDFNMANKQIGDSGMVAINTYLFMEDCSCETLTLNCNQLTLNGWIMFVPILTHNKSLKTVNFIANPIGEMDRIEGRDIYDLIEGFQHLMRRGSMGSELLGEALAKEDFVLEAINLESNSVGDCGMQFITKGMEENKTLKRARFAQNGLGDLACQQLADMLKKNETLEALDLDENWMTADGIRTLLQVLPQSKLTELGLRANKLTADVGPAFATCLETAPLQVLNLRRNNLGDGFCKHISKALEKSSLKRLELSSNHIACDGCTALAKGLEKNVNMFEILLDINCIGDEGAIQFAEMLEKNSTITHIDFAINEIKSDGLEACAAVVEKKDNLLLFKMSSSEFRTKAPVHRMNVKINQNRTTAGLKPVKLDDDSWEPRESAKVLGKLTAAQYVDDLQAVNRQTLAEAALTEDMLC